MKKLANKGLLFLILVFITKLNIYAQWIDRHGANWGFAGDVNTRVFTICATDTVDIFVGGQFNTIHNISAPNIVKFNRPLNRWQRLHPTAFPNGSVTKIIRKDSLLYIGGNFTRFGDSVVNRLVVYNLNNNTFFPFRDSSQWIGFSNGFINDLELDGNFLYIGGSGLRLHNDNTNMNGMVRYDLVNRRWRRVDTALTNVNGTVNKFLKKDSIMYILGSYENAGNKPFINICYYNFNQNMFFALDTGINNNVGTVLNRISAGVFRKDSVLIVAGSFTSAGGVNCNGLASFNFNTRRWRNYPYQTHVGPGTGTLGLEIFRDSILYLAGDFTNPYGLANSQTVNYNYILRYNLFNGIPSSAGSGVSNAASGSTSELKLIRNELWFGGGFGYVNGGLIAQRNIARLNTQNNGWINFTTPSKFTGILGEPKGLLSWNDTLAIIYGRVSFEYTANTPYIFGIAWFDSKNNQFLPLLRNGEQIFSSSQNSVYDVKRIDNNNILMVGDYGSVGGVNANRVCIFNIQNGNVRVFGSGANVGANGIVNATEIINDTLVVIGGSFDRVGGTQLLVNKIAAYSLTRNEWMRLSALNPNNYGVYNGDVLDLEKVGDTSVMIVGTFTSAANSDGATQSSGYCIGFTFNSWRWFKFGDPNGSFNDVTQVLYKDSNFIYIGGKFTQGYGQGAGGVMRYNITTNTWSNLGSNNIFGPTWPNIWTILRDGNRLFLGGNITHMGQHQNTLGGLVELHLPTNEWRPFENTTAYKASINHSSTYNVRSITKHDNKYIIMGTFNEVLGPNNQRLATPRIASFQAPLNIPCTNTTSSITVNTCNSYRAPSGKIYTNSGIYRDTILNANFCDSIITINLIIRRSTFSTINANACLCYTLPSKKVRCASGVYYDTLTNAAGCDSIITVNLTIRPTTTAFIDTSTCVAYQSPSGKIYRYSGYFLDTLVNSFGCDSFIYINLVVRKPDTSNMVVEACRRYVSPGGKLLTTSGIYHDTLRNTGGCDSVVIIYLTIVDTDKTITISGNSLISNNTTPANFQWYDCIAKSIIAGETSRIFNPQTAGTYAVIIYNGSCNDTSECVVFTPTSIKDNVNNMHFEIWPNPNNGIVKIKSSFNDREIIITDILGRLKISKNLKPDEIYEIVLEKGIYLVTDTKSGKFQKLIVQ
ncbi:MAG: T9SS type A sorting domain-containing protein [Bacteroidia bacterium]